jgi:GNAT superfamily N-acetyltransferase
MAPTFHEARPADTDVLLGMMRELYTVDRIPFDADLARTALTTLLQEPTYGCAWLIMDRAEPVGYLVLTFNYSLEYGGRDAFIDELFVRESHRRRGIGTQALQMAEAACHERGICALHLEVEVERSNVAAQAAYRRAGFVDHDRYLMTKRLDSATVVDSPPRP